MADQTLHCDKRLIPYVRILVCHQLHHACLPPEICEYPAKRTGKGVLSVTDKAK